jgi:outer membrane lipoprotein-sorting protein
MKMPTFGPLLSNPPDRRTRGAPRTLLILLGAAAPALLAGAAGAAVDAAPPPAAATAAPSVEQIVERNVQARGGLDAWRALKTLGEKGYIEHGQLKGPKKRHGTPVPGHGAMDQNLPFTLQIKRPHKLRLEMNLGDATALQLFDGKEGWTVQPSPKGPLMRRFSPAEAQAQAEQNDPEGPLIDAAAKGTIVTLDGEDTVEGHAAYKLSLAMKSGPGRHVWVDKQTYLDLKIDGARLIEGRVWPTETYFYDWKTAGRLKLPYRIETAVNDVRTSSRIVVEHVTVNAPIADDVFSLPKSVVASPITPPPAPAAPTRAPAGPGDGAAKP